MRYSSEEESDTEVKAKKEAKNRRATMAAPSAMPAPVSKLPLRKNAKRSEPEEVEVAADERKVVTSTTTTRSSRTVKSSSQDYDTGSDSESEVTAHMEAKKSSNHSYEPEPRSSPAKTTRLSPEKSRTESSFSRNTTYTSATSASPSRYSTNYNSPASEYAADRLNQIRSRLSLGNPGKNHYIATLISIILLTRVINGTLKQFCGFI